MPRAEQDRRHVVAVEDDRLVVAVVLRQLDAGDGGEGRHQIEAAEDVVVLRAGRDLARHPGDRGNAVAAFTHGALGAAERRVAGVRIDVLPGAVVGRVEDQRILVEAERADLVHDAADAGVELDDRVGDTCSWTGTYGCSRDAACSAGAPS